MPFSENETVFTRKLSGYLPQKNLKTPGHIQRHLLMTLLAGEEDTINIIINII